ncbi:conserved protein of unknown function [Petrocella atlantisensis]|uniref:Peptidase M23 n=1 Tax=Petrocella atlantisensis TaxID=2173034 RepID=A0A3P7PWC2_9FIRM|nr:M23 family metallopeptidase [Petrocella atlantisensis]VDN48047.1 conserved protein of unknown function [Petrocella atlantisensis]
MDKSESNSLKKKFFMHLKMKTMDIKKLILKTLELKTINFKTIKFKNINMKSFKLNKKMINWKRIDWKNFKATVGTIMKEPKRVIAIGFVSVMLISGIGITQSLVISMGSDVTMASDDEEVSYVEVMMNNQVLGYVPSVSVGQNMVEAARVNLIERMGYDPELTQDIKYIPQHGEKMIFTDEKELLEILENTMYAAIEDIKVKGFVMKIGDDFTVALESEEALKAVLEGAQKVYLEDESTVSVEMKKDPHNTLVMKPEIKVLQKELTVDRNFLTSATLSATAESEESGKVFESVVKEISLEQQIVVIEAFVNADEIVDVETATSMITKENEKVKTYTVQTGDSPSVIALSNGMTTRELYDLNAGLEERASKIQIGEELIVMVPEPELFVSSVEEVVYTEIIDKHKVYVDNPNAYIGTDEVLEPGVEGVLEVHALIKKLNGKEFDRVILEETVISEPTTEKILRGSKALPITNATGTFQVPMIKYRLTSKFGPRWGRMHTGIDLAGPRGTEIKAADGGRVIAAGWDGGYGYRVVIDHGNGMTSLYAHASAIYVKVGQDVGKYERIAAVGNTGNSTGPHLHFEIHVNGVRKDPMKYLKF